MVNPFGQTQELGLPPGEGQEGKFSYKANPGGLKGFGKFGAPLF